MFELLRRRQFIVNRLLNKVRFHFELFTLVSKFFNYSDFIVKFVFSVFECL